MESSSTQINEIIQKIKPLLKYAEEQHWLQYFDNIECELESDDKTNAIKLLKMSFQGGMGSFSDLVLHKNGIPLIEENNELEKLKDKLFDTCEEFLISNR